MHATAQLPTEVAPQVVDLGPPVRAESINLVRLISHRTTTQSNASVESVAEIFKNGTANFVAVLEDGLLRGMCSRQGTATLLGGRYGFSLWARKSIGEHLCGREARIKVGTPIRVVLSTVFARPNENFYDDVMLTDETGGFLGFITTETLFKVQNALLLTNICELEDRDREILAKNEQMETDLRMATELQQALMPSAHPRFPADASEEATTLRFYHRYLPANQMGGDFFHIARLEDKMAGICICDVMGHGVRAALVTAMLRALIETHAGDARDPGQLLKHLNREFTGILKQTGTLVFATVLYCVVDIAGRVAHFARAGHPAPLHVRRAASGVQSATVGTKSAGPALGLIPDAVFQTSQVQLAVGDVLLFFTDGLIEAEASGNQFGVEGLRRSLASHFGRPTGELLDAIIEDVSAFSASRIFADDVCLVAAELPSR